MSRKIKSIAIIGAGMAGLTAARRLQAAGLSATVYDKGRGPGGRMSTRRHDEYRFDHGAQYFTARGAGFRELVDRWVAAGTAAVWDASVVTIDKSRGARPADSRIRYVGTPGMSAVVAALTNGLDVSFGKRVHHIRRDSDLWALTDVDGNLLGRFDALVVAIPPAQAIELLADFSDAFAEVRKVVMAPCWTLMAAFEDRIDTSFDAAMVQHSPLSWLARNTTKPGRPDRECWTLHGSPQWSLENIDSDVGQVRAALLEALAGMVPHDTLEPAFSSAHLWRYARAERPLGVDSLWNAQLSLGVCGDWCLGSRVEDAFSSGLSLAERVVGLR